MSDVFCINLGYVVAADEADKVEAVFRKHAAWMTDFYSEENDGPAHLITAHFTKAPEFKDPANPDEGLTGNIVFTINEKFTSMESIQRHVGTASENDYFQQFYEILGQYGKVISVGGEVFYSIR